MIIPNQMYMLLEMLFVFVIYAHTIATAWPEKAVKLQWIETDGIVNKAASLKYKLEVSSK